MNESLRVRIFRFSLLELGLGIIIPVGELETQRMDIFSISSMVPVFVKRFSIRGGFALLVSARSSGEFHLVRSDILDLVTSMGDDVAHTIL